MPEAGLVPIRLGGRSVGPGEAVLLIAEAGVNHNGDVRRAHELVAAAAATGADAIKFQTFDPELLTTSSAPQANYQRRAATATTQREMLSGLVLPRAAWPALKADAESRGLMFLSTPFDAASLDLLVDLKVPAIKVSSGDLDNTPLLRLIAAARLPVLLSTGMATLADVARALDDLGDARTRTVLLHCVSAYPAPTEECNLRVIPILARAFRVPVGFSDHTLGEVAAVAAVCMGACVIEKHLTVDPTLPGPDHAASLDPERFKAMATAIRTAEVALGSPLKRPMPSEMDVRTAGRRSLVAARDLEAGSRLTPEMLMARRPSGGLPPTSIDLLVGRVLKRSLVAEEALRWEDVELA